MTTPHISYQDYSDYNTAVNDLKNAFAFGISGVKLVDGKLVRNGSFLGRKFRYIKELIQSIWDKNIAVKNQAETENKITHLKGRIKDINAMHQKINDGASDDTDKGQNFYSMTTYLFFSSIGPSGLGYFNAMHSPFYSRSFFSEKIDQRIGYSYNESDLSKVSDLSMDVMNAETPRVHIKNSFKEFYQIAGEIMNAINHRGSVDLNERNFVRKIKALYAQMTSIIKPGYPSTDRDNIPLDVYLTFFEICKAMVEYANEEIGKSAILPNRLLEQAIKKAFKQNKLSYREILELIQWFVINLKGTIEDYKIRSIYIDLLEEYRIKHIRDFETVVTTEEFKDLVNDLITLGKKVYVNDKKPEIKAQVAIGSYLFGNNNKALLKKHFPDIYNLYHFPDLYSLFSIRC